MCRCDCGNETVINRDELIANTTVSCGCFRREILLSNSVIRHGESCTRSKRETREYRAWAKMIRRCEARDGKDWPLYGGRSITVCARWRESYEAFLADMGRKPNQSYSLDRIDNDGNYEPANCRWATPLEQRHNQRRALQPPH